MSETLLAIDTSTEACSVALLYNKEITYKFQLSQREHAQHILQLVDELLKESDCSLSQLDGIAYGKGPGSFTGVRIGIGVAQGIGFGLDRPLIGVSSLITLAQGANRLNNSKKVISAIDARMKEVYLGGFSLNTDNQWIELIKPCVIKPSQVDAYLNKLISVNEEWVGVGTGWESYLEELPSITLVEPNLPSSQDMIVIASAMFKAKEMEQPEEAQAFYLRNEVTWNKLPGRG